MGKHHGRNRSGPASARRATLRHDLPAADEKRRHENGQDRVGALWLAADKTSPYQFYQYWINLDDADVGKCLRFFTDFEQPEIEAILQEHRSDPGQRTAQRRLAAELTRLVHGAEGLDIAQRATDVFFGAEISRLSDAQLAGIFADVPSKELPRDRLTAPGLSIIDALCEAGLAKSKSDARRIVTQGGAYVNNCRIEAVETQLTAAHLAGESVMVLRSGKKNHALLRFV